MGHFRAVAVLARGGFHPFILYGDFNVPPQTLMDSGSADTVNAVVVRTGFLTTKGRLVLSIMYPAPVDFKFEQDSYKFVGFLAAIAFTGKEFS